MPIMTKNSVNNETPNHLGFWSYCLAIVSVFFLADVLTGGFFRESIFQYKVEYGSIVFAMIATIGVYASDGSPGLKFSRACSRHKL
ncbi:MAG: hypothetical protein KBD76_10850 [Bacteriovorax sp.]|jgi:hypothetical protein|nr:hypothetical protein [Bacteriovorax sp.]